MNIRQHSYLGIVFSILYLPIFILILYSFNQASYSMQWQGATLKWYKELLNDNHLWLACSHSLVLSVISSSLATLLGTVASISFYHYRFAGRKVLFSLLFILIVVPDIVYATSLLIFFQLSHIPLGFYSLLIAHVSFSIPFVMLLLNAQIKQLNRHLFDAASDLGANDFVIIKRIMIPLLLPAILAGWLLSFTLSFDDVLVSYFVAGPSFEILPLHIYSLIRTGIKPEINALCSILFLISLLTVSIAYRLLKKRP